MMLSAANRSASNALPFEPDGALALRVQREQLRAQSRVADSPSRQPCAITMRWFSSRSYSLPGHSPVFEPDLDGLGRRARRGAPEAAGMAPVPAISRWSRLPGREGRPGRERTGAVRDHLQSPPRHIPGWSARNPQVDASSRSRRRTVRASRPACPRPRPPAGRPPSWDVPIRAATSVWDSPATSAARPVPRAGVGAAPTCAGSPSHGIPAAAAARRASWGPPGSRGLSPAPDCSICETVSHKRSTSLMTYR